MPEDPYVGWSLSDRLQLLAFEAELARLPRGLITALWEAIDLVRVCPVPSQNSSIWAHPPL